MAPRPPSPTGRITLDLLVATVVFVGAILILSMLVACGSRHCKLVEIVPRAAPERGAVVYCDGEPWGEGAEFRDERCPRER